MEIKTNTSQFFNYEWHIVILIITLLIGGLTGCTSKDKVRQVHITTGNLLPREIALEYVLKTLPDFSNSTGIYIRARYNSNYHRPYKTLTVYFYEFPKLTGGTSYIVRVRELPYWDNNRRFIFDDINKAEKLFVALISLGCKQAYK